MNSTIFNFSGSPKSLSISVKLSRKGPFVAGLESFRVDDVDVDVDAATSSAKETHVDELRFDWMQKCPSPFDEPIQLNMARSEHRLFTILANDELPAHLKPFAKPSYDARKRSTTDYASFLSNNVFTDAVVLRKCEPPSLDSSRSVMYLLAFLGQSNTELAWRDVHLVCRITLIDQVTLKFEPALSASGIPLESRFGDYVAQLEVIDEPPPKMSQHQRPSVTSLPEAATFVVPPENVAQATVCLTIVEAEKFQFDGLSVDYKLRLPSSVRLLRGALQGTTQRTTAPEDGVHSYSHTAELSFEMGDDDDDDVPLLMLRVHSHDGWGRQYVTGYGCLHLPLKPGRSESTVQCWRPIDPSDWQAELTEFFVGQAVDTDYFGLSELNASDWRAGVEAQSSGSVRLSTAVVVQARHLMARDVLYQLKFGAKMADMGLRSEFYQRIMKVLMDFEQARTKILLARAVKKESIRSKPVDPAAGGGLRKYLGF